MKIYLILFFLVPLKSMACSSSQEFLINSAQQQVLKKIQSLEAQWENFRLDQVKENFVIPNNRVWINNHPRYSEYHRYWQKLAATLLEMRVALQQDSIKSKCDNSWLGKCNGDTKAYVNFFMGKPLKTIHFCSNFFNEDPITQAETLMHEYSHATSSTDDYALSWSNGEKSNLLLAAQDAYHIQEFYRMDARALMLRTSWHWLFPISTH